VTILFHSTMDDPEAWVPRLADLLPGETVRAWPDGDPEAIDLAVLWTQPPGGLGRYPKLRFVQSIGAGVNQLDLASFPKGVSVARLVDPGMAVLMADYCLAAILRHHRRFDAHARSQQAGSWRFEPPRTASAFPVGVMGLGWLGSATATRLRDNGYPVRGWSRRSKALAGVAAFSGPDALPAFLDGLAAVICLLPLTPETEGILNEKMFAMLPDGTCLVNAGRGAHLVEADLLAALETGRLAGATLDVFRDEPLPPEHPFWTHDRVFMTPHVASFADPDEAGTLVADNIRRVRRGEAPLHKVEPARGY
jgi:glyoxylate/hydroxypyruvate reductase A